MIRRHPGSTRTDTLLPYTTLFRSGPVGIAMSYTIGEVREWIGWVLEANRDGAPVPARIAALPRVGPWLGVQWERHIGAPGAIGELIQIVSGANIGNIYRAVIAAGDGVFHLFLALLFMLIALFFVYRDGASFTRQIDRTSPRLTSSP